MNQYLPLLLILTTACDTNNSIQKNGEANNKKIFQPIQFENIIGERIDGPAVVRNKPNGEALFELFDNALVDVTQVNDGWYQLLVGADIKYDEFGIDSIQKGRLIICKGDTIGRILKTHSIGTGQGKDESYAMLYGYTYKDNIKPETIIENVLEKKLAQNHNDFGHWTDFIKSFQLEKDAIGYEKYETYYNYENGIDDPSPGFRIVLLFKSKQLVGIIHSRKFEMANTTTNTAATGYNISFFNSVPMDEQMTFINYMSEWLKGVD